jgi:hypothetical protein
MRISGNMNININNEYLINKMRPLGKGVTG